MARASEEEVLNALRQVKDPDRDQDVVSLEMISGLVVKDGNVGFAIEVDPERGAHLEPLRKACEEAVDAVPGVLSVTAVLTAERQPSAQQPAPEAPPPPSPGGMHPGQGNPAPNPMPGIGAIVAVASGKGGVGKSTVAVNLAVALARSGKRVGLLDADIYGPSMPRMLGIDDKPTTRDDMLVPLENHDLKCMSIGFLLDPDTPTIWRGPMVIGALEQLLRDVDWGELDILVVDMPPGTGDVQLSMSQRVPLAGAVIVSTPQDVALGDARKGLNMFRRMDVPIIGLIENMSYFNCPKCDERTDIFGHGGARRTAEEMDCAFLGELPLDASIRETSDAGQPITIADPESVAAKAFVDIAAEVSATLERDGAAPAAPTISFE